MALVVSDRVKETTTTTGTGAITLGGAMSNFRAFSSALSNGDVTYYAIVDDTNSEHEVGKGTYTSSGNTLSRDTIFESTNSDAAVDLQSGSKTVFITFPADKVDFNEFIVTNNGTGNYVFNGTGTSDDSNPTLYLSRGNTYQFIVNASGHPFYLKTTAGTGTGNQYTDGVTNNGADTGTVLLNVQMDAPDTIYYNCANHSSMAGTIYILDSITSALNDLSDVDTASSSPSNGQSLIFNSSTSKFEPGTPSSGITTGKAIAIALIFG
jgi:hypothetical protein